MEGMPVRPIEIAGMVAGVVLCLVRAFPVFKGAINGKAFTAVMLKLIGANNIDRGIKLCNAAPNAWFVRMVRPLLVGLKEIDGELGRGLVREELEVRFYRARKEELARARRFWWLSIIGLLLAGGASGMALSRGVHEGYLMVAPLMALSLTIWTFRSVSRAARESEAGGREIIAALADKVVAAAD
jgi:hypothetical protein